MSGGGCLRGFPGWITRSSDFCGAQLSPQDFAYSCTLACVIAIMEYNSVYYNDPAAYGQAYNPADYAQMPYGQTPYGQALSGQTPYGQAPYGQAPSGQAPYGQDPYGQAPSGQAPYGQDPYGQAPYGQDPYGQTPYGQTPYGQTPYGPGDFGQAGPAGYVPVPAQTQAAQPSGGGVWLTTTVMCFTMLLLIGIILSTLAYLATNEEALSTAEEVEFPVVSGSSPAGEDVPVPLAEPPTTSTMPTPVVTTKPPTAPMMRPTVPTAPPAEPPIEPTMRATAPTMPPPGSTMSPRAPRMTPTALTIRPTVPIEPPAEPPEEPTMPPTAPTVAHTKPSVSVFIPDEATDKQPMLCTMSDRITSSLQFPPDALCDYIFFDSLYKGGRNLLTDAATYSNSLGTFLIEHRAYRRTTLGVGFAFK
ncbi:uncharacterized protein LOC119449040 [Dermacentor silvarum]|uniref:uncharacterized protein LOC119449040 n=1 Tax=Dermacentor silvarum TaxID=543639 RepID=UPI00189B01CF|nr:uncharacterized protein LOC119449040 [Dermacentor silvarum]